jgi:hypothetical protein
VTNSIKDCKLRKGIPELLTPGSNRAVFIENHDEKIIRANEKGKVLYAVLEEKVISDGLGFSLQANQFLYTPYNQKVTQLIESGIAKSIDEKEQEKIIQKMTNFKIHEKKVVKRDHKVVLTFEHLGVWFRIYLLLLGIASAVFLGEWIVGMSGISWKMRKIIDEPKENHSIRKRSKKRTVKMTKASIKKPQKIQAKITAAKTMKVVKKSKRKVARTLTKVELHGVLKGTICETKIKRTKKLGSKKQFLS